MNAREREMDGKPKNYKFKYIYLVLTIIFAVIVSTTYLLPQMFPQFFHETTWIITKDTSGNSQIEMLPENVAMIVLDIIRNVCITGFVGVILYAFYEHRFESEEKQEIIDTVNNFFLEDVKKNFTQSLMLSENIVRNDLSTQLVDKILLNCLEQKVGDEEKANAIMKSLLDNVINKSGTIQDLDVSMTLEEFKDKGHIYSSYNMYKMTYVIRYKTILSENSFDFILTNSKDIQNKNLSIFKYIQFVDSSFSSSEVFFNVNEITIDGQQLMMQGSRIKEDNYILEKYWDDSCAQKVGNEVQICYSVEFLVRKKGNHYSYFTPCMTNGIHLKFDASRTDIMRIKLLTYFNSGEKPTILPPVGKEENPKTIEITLNDWILPLSGAAFIWQFEKK